MKLKDKVVNLIKKKSVYLLFLVPIAAVCGCGKTRGSDSDDVVYVCTGPSAECYHVDRDCWGLGNCSGEIEEMSVSSADDYYRPCSICSK